MPQNISIFGSQAARAFSSSALESLAAGSLSSFSSGSAQQTVELSTVSEAELKISKENLKLTYKIKSKELDAAAIKKIEGSIGYQFKNKKLLVQALTTRAKDSKRNYERQEYFGDTVLEMMVTKILLRKYPDATEGALTAAGSVLVRQEALAALCLRLGLHEYLQDTKPVIPISSLCDIIESITGAIYEDGGEKAAQEFTLRFFLPMVQDKKCPQQMAKIILAAAKETREDISYKKSKKGYVLVKSSGTGLVTKLQFQKKVPKSKTKADPARLALYRAEKAFIQRELDAKYQQYLVRLAIDLGYKPLAKLPTLNLSWNVGEKINFRVRLHTLMQMLGCKAPAYVVREDTESAASRFVCTLTYHPFKPVASSAATKAEAEEAVAEVAYKQVQKTVLVTEEFVFDSKKAIDDLDPKDPVACLNLLCQKLGLRTPTYISCVREKNNSAVLYTCLNAPWLTTEIRGPSCATVNESKAAVARKLISLIKHFAESSIEPKRLQALCTLGNAQDSVSVLHSLCQTCSLEQPKMETHICEGPVSDGILFQTVTTVADKHWGNKVITGEKSHSKTGAEKSAATKILNYFANKMFEEEIASARA